MTECELQLAEPDGGWTLAGQAALRFVYLTYLADRNYSRKTVRAYGYDLLAFCLWLVAVDVQLTRVTIEVLLLFLRACRDARLPGCPRAQRVKLTGRRMNQHGPHSGNPVRRQVQSALPGRPCQ